MRGHIPTWVYEFAHSVASIPFLKKTFKPLYYHYKDRMNGKRNRQFREHSLEILRVFDNCMVDNGFH